MLETTPISAFSDNYLWLIHGREDPRRVAVVDPGDARPVLETLERDGLTLDTVLVTHHHGDHVGGVAELVERFGVPVLGPAHERIPCRTRSLSGGDRVRLDALDLEFQVIDCPGHTAGHIAYYGHGCLFCGDTLFSAGCGRLFEGTPEQMNASLHRLAALPAETRVFCAHEYTLSNLRFAAAVEPENAAVRDYAEQARTLRADGRPTLPSTLGLERRVNPFLRCSEPDVVAAAQRHAGARMDDETAVFAVIRGWKDSFA
jgi:hydroxyacylglutathione hydrolase